MAYEISSTKDLDPATIVTAQQYNLLRNLYGRLVDYDANSQLISGIAESFVTQANSVTFTFGEKAKTIDGHIITARDAEVSLKRIIMKGRSGHGDIRRLICPEARLKNLDDPCKGIKSIENKLILTVEKSYYLPLLLEVLESADFSIIPETNIDKTNGSLKDQTHRNTSGPYYADFNFQTNSYSLKANPHHYLFNIDMPQEVKLIPESAQNQYLEFINGKIDLLPTTSMFSGVDAKKIIDSDEYEIHETLPLKVMSVHFSPRAMRDFTPAQRLSAAIAIGKAFEKLSPLSNGKPALQFFQPTSEGSLNSSQLKEIQSMRENGGDSNLPKPMEYAPQKQQLEDYRKELLNYSKLRAISRKAPPYNLAPDERPDIYGVVNDSAWTEDLNLLGYNFQVGTFELPNLDNDKWFADYIATEDRAERIKKLNALHFELLRTVSMFPVQVAPYYAAIKKPWRLNQFKTAAGTRLWLIRKN